MGPLYWTVRTMDSDGVARKPLPLRSILHAADGDSAQRPVIKMLCIADKNII